MPNVIDILEHFLMLNLAEVTRKIEKLEKDRAFYLIRRKRIEDELAELKSSRRPVKTVGLPTLPGYQKN